MRKLFCENCRDDVTIKESEQAADVEIRNHVIEYIELVSHCTVCGTEVYDETHEEENFRRIQVKLDEVEKK